MTERLENLTPDPIRNDRPALAKAITLIESTRPKDRMAAKNLVETLMPYSGNSVRIGVTGVPGVGKSTFIDSLGTLLLKKDLRVAVLAVDPSSKKSGGSIMADKTRMKRLAVHPNAFIRPSPSRCFLAGVAEKSRETLLVCEAAGYDVIIVETVGSGQSEIEVASMVDFFLVLMLPGAGDEFQGIKKGVLELADAIAINKADGMHRESADLARAVYESAMRMTKPNLAEWTVPVLKCSAVNDIGVEAIWNVIQRHRQTLEESGGFEEKRKKQNVAWMHSLVEERLRRHFFGLPSVKPLLLEMEEQVEHKGLFPASAADRILERMGVEHE